MSTTEACILREFRTEYILRWSQECADLYREFNYTENSDTADRLLCSFNSSRREKRVNTIESLIFTHSSRKAWFLLKNLSSSKPSNKRLIVQSSTNKIAKRNVDLSKSAINLLTDKLRIS